jgi:hypothetical protein
MKMSNRKIATLSASVPAIHGNDQAIDDDQTGAACRVEYARYERRILDLENAVRAERDRLRREHLEAMRLILGQQAAE